MEICVAATRRDEAKAVAVWWPGANGFVARDLNYCGYTGFTVDWDVAANDRYFAKFGKRPYSCSGYFCRDLWLSSDPDGFVEWNGTDVSLAFPDAIANPELLAETPYRYCGWTPGCGLGLMEVLHAYAANPKIELLVKAGLFNLARSKSKLARVEKDAVLRRILARSPDLAHRLEWVDLLWLAGSDKRTPDEAEARTKRRRDARQFFKAARFNLPIGIERVKAFHYCNAHGINAGVYAEAMTLAVEQGFDLRSRSVSFPTDFDAFYVARIESRDRCEDTRGDKSDKMVARFVEELKRIIDEAKPDLEGYEIVWMPRQIDFVREGKRMGNCIGGGFYSREMGQRKCVCLVLVCNDERVDVQIGSDWKVRQCYAAQNHAPTTAATRIAARIANTFRRHYAKAA